MKKILLFLYSTVVSLLSDILSVFGYEILLLISKKNSKDSPESINLNIGAGEYTIKNFISLDFYSKHYYPNKKKFLKKRVPFDIRSDAIPYNENAVDNIYASHVIEHIEDEHVDHFLSEAYRVLKPGGVLRIACPDTKFLFQVSKFENDYWRWRHRTLSNVEKYNVDWDDLSQMDFLIRELATPRFRYNRHKTPNLELQSAYIKELDYKALKKTLRNSLSFRESYPSDHINAWDLESLSALGAKYGFSHIFESKQFGSVSNEMSGFKFDRTRPQMTLYVEMVK